MPCTVHYSTECLLLINSKYTDLDRSLDDGINVIEMFFHLATFSSLHSHPAVRKACL